MIEIHQRSFHSSSRSLHDRTRGDAPDGGSRLTSVALYPAEQLLVALASLGRILPYSRATWCSRSYPNVVAHKVAVPFSCCFSLSLPPICVLENPHDLVVCFPLRMPILTSFSVPFITAPSFRKAQWPNPLLIAHRLTNVTIICITCTSYVGFQYSAETLFPEDPQEQAQVYLSFPELNVELEA